MNTVAIIQARVSSTRLPGKVLKDIAGQPVLKRIVRRVQHAKVFGEVVVATSDDGSDDPIAELCSREQVPCFRGSLPDVLDRFYRAALQYKADAVARFTADCPLLDPGVIRRVVEAFRSGQYDYACNILPPTFPDGLDTEVFSMRAIERSHNEAVDPFEREHMDEYVLAHLDEFPHVNVMNDTDLSRLRWTLDEERDLRFVRAVYEHFRSDDFGMHAVLAFLDAHPEVQKLNEGIERNAGGKRP